MKKEQTYKILKARIENRDDLQNKLDEYIVIVKKELDNFNTADEPRLYQVAYQNLLQRLYLSIKSFRLLLGEFDRNYYFRFPVATQMRVAILDSLTVAYLVSFIQDESDEKIKHELARLEQPLARKLSKEIDQQSFDSKGQNHQKADLIAMFPYNYSSDGSLKKIKDLRPGDMAKFIKQTPLSWFEGSYFLYFYFSQYEHYSPKSKFLLESDPDFDFDKFVYATYWIFAASCLCFDALQVKSHNKMHLKKLRDSIASIPPLT